MHKTTNHRTSAAIVARLIVLVKPMLPIMVAAIVMGVAGHFCATFITIFGGFGILRALGLASPLRSVGVAFACILVFALLRGILREKRIGHAGTLDPMATGVLPVFVGRATKAVQFAENGRKEYRAVLKLGTVTDTQDTTGAVLEAHPVTVGADEVRAALEHFTGELLQLPPMYSALKVNGQKLYDLARQGKTVERKPRAITVYELELLEQSAPDEFALRVVCSKGTYIRTLCQDLGQALGCGGCMAALRRTMAAGFRIEEAVTLERAQEEREALLLPLDEYFRACPRFTVQNETQEKRAYNGNAFTARGVADGSYRVYDRAGNFLSLSRAEGGELHAIKNFF